MPVGRGNRPTVLAVMFKVTWLVPPSATLLSPSSAWWRPRPKEGRRYQGLVCEDGVDMVLVPGAG